MSGERIWVRLRRRAAAVTAMVVLAGIATSGSGAPTPAGAQEDADTSVGSAPASRPATWVTLVTGDRVLVTPTDPEDGEADVDVDVVTVEPGPGREGMAFQRFVLDGDAHVVPADAFALLGQGRVDRRLFDVSGLVRSGYDDLHRDTMPLVVVGGDPAPAVRASGDTAARELPSIDAVAVEEAKSGATTFWAELVGEAPAGEAATLASGVTEVWLDAPVQATLDHSVAQVGAPEAWAAGHTGQGARVAVLDSGVDPAHPDLGDPVVAAQDFTGNPRGTVDGNGHGTHVASIVTGSGEASDGRYQGVAPDAGLLVGKVLDDHGVGRESWVVSGMEWAAAQDADVVNMSLGSAFASDGTDPLSLAVDRLTDQTGSLFVVAAGNDGPDGLVGSPAAADRALTVGAVDDDDQLAEFSTRGPRSGRPAIKPEITAPGVAIAAAQADGTYLGPTETEGYASLSGTSMATAHVAGAAAILAAQHPDWDAGELKGVLVGSAEPHDDLTVDEQGSGRLDVARADRQPVHTTPVAVDAGTAAWPHDDDEPSSTPVTYHNPTAAPVTLSLAFDVEDPDGDAAPGGMFTVSTDEVTVAPGGQATVEVTVDTRVAGPDGRYGGVLVATTPDGAVRTPVAVTREVETHDVTVEAVDHQGQPTIGWFALFVSLDEPRSYAAYGFLGTPPLRLPAGRYLQAWSVTTDTGEWPRPTTYAFEPTVEVTQGTTLRLDAREGRPVGMTVDRPDAQLTSGWIDVERETAWGTATTGVAWIDDFATTYLRPSSTATPNPDDFGLTVAGYLVPPAGDAGGPHLYDDPADGPHLYGAAWSASGEVPDDLVRHVPDEGMATVRSPMDADPEVPLTGALNGRVRVPLPGQMTQRYSPGVLWPRGFAAITESGDAATQLALVRSYEAGQRYREPWNRAVFGPMDPSVPALRLDGGTSQVRRRGPYLTASVELFSQQGLHLGSSTVDQESIALYRDGEPVARLPFGLVLDPTFGQVPWEEASYRLEASATRSVVSLSTRVDVAWTFRMEGGPGEIPAPLLGVRMDPHLDDHSRAPSGERFRIPVHVGRQPGADYGRLTELTVDVSYDDGQTWQPAQVRGTGDDRAAVVTHPDGPGYVSLRVRAADTDGNAVETTIVRAYALTG